MLSASHTKDSSTLPIIQLIKPEFHHMGGTAEAKKESEEAVWLRTIQRLSAIDLGISDNQALEKFKALLIIQTHQLFYLRAKWQIAHAALLLKKIQQKVDAYHATLCKIFVTNSFMLFDNQETQIKKRLEETFRPYTTTLKDHLKKCFQYETTLHLNADAIFPVYSIYEKLADELESFFIDYLAKHVATPPTAYFHKKIHQSLGYNVFRKNVVKGAQRFNINEIKKVSILHNLDVTKIAMECGFEDNIKEITGLHDEYIKFQEKYLQLFNDTLAQIQQIIPQFTQDDYWKHYQKVFEIFQRPQKETFYIDDFLYELYLQQARKPYIQSDLYADITDIYLPAANFYYTHRNVTIRITIEDLSRWMHDDRIHNTFPDSLHKIVEDAYKVLHNDLLNENTQNNETKHDELLAVELETFNLVENYSNPVSTLPKKLFTNTVPGTLEEENIKTLDEIGPINSDYQKLFEPFSKEVEIFEAKLQEEDKTDDRAQALELFNKELEKLKSIDSIVNIAALVSVAKPYLNRHRYYFWASIRSTINSNNINTTTWKEAFSRAQSQALEILKDAFNKSPEQTFPLLHQWRNHSLFTEDYGSTEWFKWLKGKEKAQDTLDKMIASYQTQHAIGFNSACGVAGK